ncbi:hypothetical protein LCGC14_0796410 [marine sediment metagenome]|uniref:DUF1922 domain-containing protein n=1 Tax=marine sediment metagenome TaxID=412755 RepID=A0A0F9PVD2_9ZZZZ|nr:DUF1922 domain-containing protein [bacterium]
MEEVGFKKDETPYIVFPCSKCKQYMYVKMTQKTKRCLRCGRHHKVVSIINSGEIIDGITNAVDMVKQKQTEFATKESGSVPEFRAMGDFKSSNKIKFCTVQKKENLDINEDYSADFKRMLSEISNMYKKFPYYLIEIMAEDYNIPETELKILVRNSITNGILNQAERNLYELNAKKFKRFISVLK